MTDSPLKGYSSNNNNRNNNSNNHSSSNRVPRFKGADGDGFKEPLQEPSSDPIATLHTILGTPERMPFEGPAQAHEAP